MKSLPDNITSASSLTVFQRKLKTHLFYRSYPDIGLFLVVFAMLVLTVMNEIA